MVKSCMGEIWGGGGAFEDRHLKTIWAVWTFLLEVRVDNPSSRRAAVAE